jgi:hypothetical protein
MEFPPHASHGKIPMLWCVTSHIFQLADDFRIRTIRALLSRRLPRTSAGSNNQGVPNPADALLVFESGVSMEGVA